MVVDAPRASRVLLAPSGDRSDTRRASARHGAKRDATAAAAPRSCSARRRSLVNRQSVVLRRLAERIERTRLAKRRASGKPPRRQPDALGLYKLAAETLRRERGGHRV